MRSQSRQVLTAAVLSVVLAIKLFGPGGTFGRSAPEPFPGDVVARAAAPVNIYRDSPQTRVLQLLTSMDAMWADAFRASGDTYKPPMVETRETQEGGECGGSALGDWAGLYCPGNRHIAIDLGDHRVRRAAAGDELSDDLLGYVLAHEVGHHVQTLRGAPNAAEGNAQLVTLRRELHAECLSGVWARAANRPPQPEWSYAADGKHGSVEQQRHFFNEGYGRGAPADCDAAWKVER